MLLRAFARLLAGLPSGESDGPARAEILLVCEREIRLEHAAGGASGYGGADAQSDLARIDQELASQRDLVRAPQRGSGCAR